MVLDGILAIWRQVRDELYRLRIGHAGTLAHGPEMPVVVVTPQEKRSNGGLLATLVPAEPRHHTVGIALVFHLEHRTLVRFVESRFTLRDHAVQPRSLKSTEPIGGDDAVPCGRCQMNRRLCMCHQGLGTASPRRQRTSPHIRCALAEESDEHDGC